MNPIADSTPDAISQAAADWWTRLRDPHAAAGAVEQWLAWAESDPRHLAAFEQVNALAERAGGLDADARRRIAREFSAPVAPAWRRPLWLAVAAATVLAVGTGLLVRRHAQTPTTLVYTSAVAQNRDIVLPDDTQVSLGGASTLNVHFSAGERRVELAAGEAFFRIAHDPRRAFVVEAADLSVRDVGTAFDVRRTGDRVTVAVTQGRVRIAGRGSGANADPRAVEALAGQRVSWDPAARALRIGSIQPDQATAWRQGALEFLDEPLGVVVANVNRYRARPVRIASADLARLTFTGTVRTDAVEPWLLALPTVFPLRIAEARDATVLSAR